MKRLRLLLVVLMSLVIPVNGFAATLASPCPMQTQDSDNAMQADEMTAMSASMPDCCLEMDKGLMGVAANPLTGITRLISTTSRSRKRFMPVS